MRRTIPLIAARPLEEQAESAAEPVARTHADTDGTAVAVDQQAVVLHLGVAAARCRRAHDGTDARLARVPLGFDVRDRAIATFVWVGPCVDAIEEQQVR